MNKYTGDFRSSEVDDLCDGVSISMYDACVMAWRNFSSS